MTVTPGDIPGANGEVFVVGDLRVAVGQQRVTRAGLEITLPNLSFELLLALVRVAPNLLSNDLLMARVWPGQVVSPETIAKRVNLLRTALGDNAQEPRYIAGVRGRGYRLVAAVSAEERPAPAIATQPSELPTRDTVTPQSRSITARVSPMGWLVLSVLLVVAVALALGMRALTRVHSADTRARQESPLREPGEISARSRTVAVLPFDNISAAAADVYLARGFPEMILNRLSRMEGLTVIARNSSFALQTANLDSGEIGRRLNSAYLVGGSVQREASRLRVAVHLVDSSAGTLIWSAHFDRSLQDIFSVEDEIADQIADALSARLGPGTPKPPAGARSANVEAYLAFLRGRVLLGRFTVAESEAAVPFFEKAIALDPGFAPAYASLYDARMQAADKRREDMRLARERYRHLVDRSLRLDPKLGAAYFARAMWADEPYDASATPDNPLVVARERDFRLGAELDPSNGRGLDAYAQFLYGVLQRPEEAKNVLKRALWVDPLSPGPHQTDSEFAFMESGIEASYQKIMQVLELDPNFVPALHRYAQYRWINEGKLAEALRIIEHAIALDPGNSVLRRHALAIYLDLGDAEAARAVIARLPPRPSEAGLLAMHEGDWRRAGLSAYDEAAWASDSFDEDSCEFWQGEALRDYALKTGDVKRAIAFIRSKYYFGSTPETQLEVCNYRAAVYLSQLMAAAGQTDPAHDLRRAVSTWTDANEAKYLGDSHLIRAALLQLGGQPDSALAELAKSFRSGFYVQWWYTLNYDPLWVPFHGDPRFQAIAADVRRYIDAQRAELETLRERGEVPRRRANTAAH
jgi:TolB-like protein/DNA-binding winged helix-turn-helix (wHTH) protein/Tfp pilus assembly protein PilF